MALKDLDEIWDYITFKLESPVAVEHTVNGIMDSLDVLKDFSQTGAQLMFENGMDSGYRYVIYKNYMVFYHTQELEVYVDRVIYGKRDYMGVLFTEELKKYTE